MNALAAKHDCALAVFAHELREPLSSILLAAQALAETGTDTGVYGELSGLIERQGRYLARIIDGVLEARRGGVEACHLHKEWFDLARVVGEAIETSQPILSERGHRLDVAFPAKLAYLYADPLRIQQVVVNLLSNAAKYTEPGGSIHVAVEATNEHLTITVRDNGVGISAALLPRVFDLFEQAAVRLPSARYSGLGLGLAVVKSLVELHGGQVNAHSDGAGTGSTFTVRLPVFLPGTSEKYDYVPRGRQASLQGDLVMMTPMLDA